MSDAASRPPEPDREIDAVSFYQSAANAGLYDRHWGPHLCPMFLAPLTELLLRRLRPGAAVLDVCCGTGRIAGGVAAAGFAVTGIDLSLEMLALARANAPGCRLVQADARELALRPRFAGALSTGNSLNSFVDLERMTRVLANVHQALAPAGAVCFDVLLDNHQLPPETTGRLVEDDLVAVWHETFDAASGFLRGDQVHFHRRGGSWQRCDRSYISRLYPGDEVRKAFGAAGFGSVRLLDARRDLGCDLRDRTFVVAEKAS
jgi:SAM-dependent methyltransferase